MTASVRIGINTFVTDEGIRPADLGRAVEERGFDSLFLAEHSHIPASRQTPYPAGGELPRKYYRTLDPFVTLAAAASVTDRLLLGTGVALLIERDVIHTANEVASLDLISNGRAVLGVGVGWNREEMSNHGTDPSTRGALLDEQLQALRALWTNERAEFHGDFVDFDPVYLWPKPVQRPHPPIYVGGGSPAAIRRAAKNADGWFPHPVAEVSQVRPQLDQFVEAAGRDDVSVFLFGTPTRPVLDAYAEAGVDRVALALETLPYDESLTMLDELATFAADYL